MKLLSDGKTNAKLAKSNKSGKGYLTVGLSLAPHSSSGYNVCPAASEGCKSNCLYYQGRGRFNNVAKARIAKTKFFYENRPAFLAQLSKEITAWEKKATKLGLILAVRLNVLSDIAWEQYLDLSQWPNVQFYDYTKMYKRLGKTPTNYHLTFSKSEVNTDLCRLALERGFNVAVVFQHVPDTWGCWPVFDGDETDLRFLDGFGVVGLKAKGSAKKDQTGFVLPVLN